ncbi:hypothetical protein CMV_029418 [Castanea mollissima]|uniref:Uncharacterized protein n=1 Tax=Castanea mollissima TaxID=60419 RepID=A0A8J4VB05_9ROSI|nr:hypothetical protein CMV_029418 [Castanea mollissima]
MPYSCVALEEPFRQGIPLENLKYIKCGSFTKLLIKPGSRNSRDFTSKIFQGARSDISVDPQSSNRLSHQFVLSSLLFDEFASEAKRSISEDEDIDFGGSWSDFEVKAANGSILRTQWFCHAVSLKILQRIGQVAC